MSTFPHPNACKSRQSCTSGWALEPRSIFFLSEDLFSTTSLAWTEIICTEVVDFTAVCKLKCCLSLGLAVRSDVVANYIQLLI